ncbi:hypothetical protein PTTG_25922 [Puccinia triticina 1-1 BBBD Race 1]|uniref:Uncharacterized protein n=1 Tax=Puccinia triticina (isolate 1-1 / race 1 (BBBD)) TaxID=630390 RepID=A0A180GXV9_PUCT1|nr:hypothetical protein PTTG_25922 [Puccinia triticina 1-1 BBBD Race 1]
MKNFLAIPFGLLILLQATVTSPTPIPQVSGHDEKGGDVTRGPDAQLPGGSCGCHNNKGRCCLRR